MTIRDQVPPLTSFPRPDSVDRRPPERSRTVTSLATPPPGSGLRPVPGDAGTPVIGHARDMMRFGIDFALRRYEMYGPVSWMGMLGQKWGVICGPEATAVVLTNKDKAFSQGGWRFFIERFFYRGLLVLDFDEHLLQRRIMQEAFVPDRVAGYARQFTPVVREGVTGWETPAKPKLYWLLKRLTLDVATRVFMGIEPGGEVAKISKAFVDCVRAATAIVRMPLPGGRWSAGVSGRRTLEQWLSATIPEKRLSGGEDLLTALCQAEDEEGLRFSDDDIVNHMIFLMMAAHDTTTIASTAAAYHLAKHPEWQERVRAESLALGDDIPDTAALDKLESLELVIKEAVRMTAPVPWMARQAVRDTEVLGHYIPAGTNLSINPNTNHYSLAYWTDPNRFDPERFSEARREDRSHRYAYTPFGGGSHKCIGLHFGMYEVKAILHEMLRSYRWSVPGDYRMRWDYLALPVPADGFPVRLEPLSRAS